MVAVSEEYRAAIRAAVRTERLRGVLSLTDGKTVEFTEAEVMSGSVTLDDQCVSGQELQYGCAYLGQATLQLKTTLNRYLLYGAKLALWYGLQLADGSWEEVPLGLYTVAEAQRSSVYVSLTAYDNLILLDAKLGSAVLRGSVYDIICQMSEACGVEQGQSKAEVQALCNADGNQVYQISAENGCSSYRDALGVLCQPLGCFGAVDEAGRLCLRPFAATPCVSLGKGQRTGAVVADYRCHYAVLEVPSEEDTLLAVEPDGSGLTMTMSDAPLLNIGLPEMRQARVDALFAVLNASDYTPVTLQMAGDPSLCCGDRIRLTETGDAGDDTVEMLVMRRVWKFRGSSTLKALGANPYLSGSKAKDSETIRQLQSETSVNKLTFYSFENSTPIRAAGAVNETPAASINFVSTKDTSAMFLCQILLTATPQTELLTLEVHYYLNNREVTSFAPRQVLAAGAHTLSLFYPFASVSAGTNNRFAVTLTVEGGSVEIATGRMKATITGQGMASGKVWDGTLTMSEVLRRLPVENAALAMAHPLADRVQCSVKTPRREGYADRMGRLALPDNIGLTVRGLSERLTTTVVEKQHSVTALRNPPTFDAAYVTVEDDRFRLREQFEHTGVPLDIDRGHLCGVTAATTTLESVTEIEVEDGRLQES